MESSMQGTSPTIRTFESSNADIKDAIVTEVGQNFIDSLDDYEPMSESELSKLIIEFLTPKRKLPKKIAERILYRRLVQFTISCLNLLKEMQQWWDLFIWSAIYKDLLYPIRKGISKKFIKRGKKSINHEQALRRTRDNSGTRIQERRGDETNFKAYR